MSSSGRASCEETPTGGDCMIQLTRLNKQPLWVNSDLIKYVEGSPDTLLTLMGGDKIVVREACEAVVERVMSFRMQWTTISSEVDRNAKCHGRWRALVGGLSALVASLLTLIRETPRLR